MRLLNQSNDISFLFALLFLIYFFLNAKITLELKAGTDRRENCICKRILVHAQCFKLSWK